jgi:hypothetical protein
MLGQRKRRGVKDAVKARDIDLRGRDVGGIEAAHHREPAAGQSGGRGIAQRRRQRVQRAVREPDIGRGGAPAGGV